MIDEIPGEDEGEPISFRVQTEPEMIPVIMTAEGVCGCVESFPGIYSVFVDRRYDPEWVKAEIEGVLKEVLE